MAHEPRTGFGKCLRTFFCCVTLFEHHASQRSKVRSVGAEKWTVKLTVHVMKHRIFCLCFATRDCLNGHTYLPCKVRNSSSMICLCFESNSCSGTSYNLHASQAKQNGIKCTACNILKRRIFFYGPFYFVLPLVFQFRLFPSQLCAYAMFNMNYQIIHRCCKIKT